MPAESILKHLSTDATVLYVGAHPDDEHTIGPLLAHAAHVCRKVTVLCLTRGESGWNLHREDLTRTLADVRRSEFESSMKTLGCEPLMLDFVNGTSTAHPQGLAVLEYESPAVARWRSPGGRDASVEAVLQRWHRQTGDPVARILDIMRQRQPTVVLTFDPIKGYTNHPEHILVAQAATEALRQYNHQAQRPAALFYTWCPGDEGVPAAERIMTDALCRLGGRDYRAIADEAQRFYESQYGSRNSDRAAKSLFLWHDQQLLQQVL